MDELLASSLRLSTPLLFAAMGGLLCERSGIATICLEGVMLMSAFVAAVVNYYSHSPWLALLAGMAVGAITMTLHAFLSITARANQIVSGVAVNLLVAGITPIACKMIFGSATNSASIPLVDRFSVWAIPGLSSIPILGRVLFQHRPLIYVALLLPFAVHYFLYRTAWGLRLLASGDGPEALATSGVSPKRVRYGALFLGGALCAMGGVYLSISHASEFTRDMTAGRGFIALTAIILGKWKPIPAFLGCLFFGLADAVQIQLQSVVFFGSQVPVQFIQAFPYVVTLLVLVGFVGRAKPPLSIGQGL